MIELFSHDVGIISTKGTIQQQYTPVTDIYSERAGPQAVQSNRDVHFVAVLRYNMVSDHDAPSTGGSMNDPA